VPQQLKGTALYLALAAGLPETASPEQVAQRMESGLQAQLESLPPEAALLVQVIMDVAQAQIDKVARLRAENRRLKAALSHSQRVSSRLRR